MTATDTSDIEGHELFLRIEAWPLAEALAPKGFEDSLADENGWTRGFASRVTTEYRRFLHLTQVAGHPVSPSREVDAAWHLHLTRTRGYREMCETLFGRFVNHDPSSGGAGQTEQFARLYEQTLASYRRVFGCEPPADIWPPAAARFAPPPPAAAQRAAAAKRLRRGDAVVWLLGALVTGFAAAVFGLPSPLDVLGTVAWLALDAAALVALWVWAAQITRREVIDPANAPALDAEESAYAAHGRSRVALVAITALVHAGAVRLHARRGEDGKIEGVQIERTAEWPAAGTLDPAARAVAALPAGPVTSDQVMAAIARPCWEIELRLRRAGLRCELPALLPKRFQALLISLVLVGLASHRFGAALGSAEPAPLVFTLLLANLITSLVLASGEIVTPLGLAANLRARAEARRGQEHIVDAQVAGNDSATLPMNRAILTAVALTGTAPVIDDPRFAGINFAVPADSNGVTGNSESAAGCQTTPVTNDGCCG